MSKINPKYISYIPEVLVLMMFESGGSIALTHPVGMSM